MAVFASDDVAVGVKGDGTGKRLILWNLADGDKKGVYLQRFSRTAVHIFGHAAGGVFGKRAVAACVAVENARPYRIIAFCIIVCGVAVRFAAFIAAYVAVGGVRIDGIIAFCISVCAAACVCSAVLSAGA